MKAKAGLALFSSEGFDPADASFPENPDTNLSWLIRQSAQCAIAELEPHFSLVHTDVILSVDDARAACEAYAREDVDVVLVVYLMYAGDEAISEIAREMRHKPFVLWSFNPVKKLSKTTNIYANFRLTGAPGLLQACTPLRRAGVRWDFVLGTPGDERLQTQLGHIANVCETVRDLRKQRVLQVGRRFGSMMAAWIDEARLRTDVGVAVDCASIQALKREYDVLSDAEVRAFVVGETRKYPVQDLSEEDLYTSARLTLATYRLCKKHGCGLLAMQDMDEELHETFGCRPQMTYQRMFEEDMSVGMEGDVISVIATWLAHRLSDGPSMYGEVLSYSEEDDMLVIGHASMHDLRLAGDNPVTLIPDLECYESDPHQGVWNAFLAKPGTVTLFSLFEDIDGYKVFACTGESLPGEMIAPGYGHAMVKIGMPVAQFMERAIRLGTTQHFAYCYGDVKPRLKMLSERLRFAYQDLDV